MKEKKKPNTKKSVSKPQLEEKKEKNRISIVNTLTDNELGRAIKNDLIKWHDIKNWAERKKLKKFK